MAAFIFAVVHPDGQGRRISGRLSIARSHAAVELSALLAFCKEK
ncbi:hypothetical protein [Sphingomonas sp. QA11]|nr:hypothetical protein [Sphingomonas sp. QA11]